MRITFFGLGEAGSAIAAGLATAGAEVHGYDPADVPTPEGVSRHADPTTACQGSSLLIAVTAAADARAALAQSHDRLEPGTIYADLSTASPGLKVDLAAEAESRGLKFADVALMSTVPDKGLATQALVSGPGAAPYARLINELGGNVEIVGDQTGQAAARKLLRSVVAKGLTTVLIESLEAARAHGDDRWVWPHLVELITDADEALMTRLISGTPIHVERRLAEMESARSFVESLGVPSTMTAATVDALRRIKAEGMPELPETSPF